MCRETVREQKVHWGWGHEGCGQTDGTEKRQETKRTREAREKRRVKKGARGKK